MNTTVRGFSSLVFVVLSGCAAFDKGRLDPRVASQVAESRLDPPADCAFLGSVQGVAPLGEVGDAHVDVVRNAVLRGGNYVAVDLVERPVLLGLGSYVVHGRLFACPLPSARSASAAAPVTAKVAVPGDAAAPRPCEPECAAGFTCQLGACLAAPAPQAAGAAN